jgi:hypothetical protein
VRQLQEWFSWAEYVAGGLIDPEIDFANLIALERFRHGGIHPRPE